MASSFGAKKLLKVTVFATKAQRIDTEIVKSIDGHFILNLQDDEMVNFVKGMSTAKYGDIKDVAGNIYNGGTSKTKANIVPDASWKKAKIVAWMTAQKLDFNSGDTKGDLLEKIEWHIKSD